MIQCKYSAKGKGLGCLWLLPLEMPGWVPYCTSHDNKLFTGQENDLGMVIAKYPLLAFPPPLSCPPLKSGQKEGCAFFWGS